ncbi:MAG: PDZ domain-containing protein, partial [Synechococcaceae cyanobacterium RL_1_2]|nr:PDZ domain-containing protein [Synechococcaceae cyanobacterium RL_1_2]
KINTSGELSGVGLQININPDNGILEVVAPLAGSPAENAGIIPLDQIMAIDGIATEDLSLDEAAAKMRGAIGTKVILSIQTPGETLRDVTLTRDRIELSALTYRLDDQIKNFPVGYLKLSQFSASAYGEMVRAIETLEAEGAKGYILDLRNNPGGLLQAGIEIARIWLDNPSTVVYTVDRQGTLDSFEAESTMMTHAPLVLLVNKGTASASEILAGALQDNDRATLIGDTTFGKGLIQSLFELRNGAGLAVTIAQYETPDHHNINKLGIAPDIQVDQAPITFKQIGTADDLQYQAALSQLQPS